MLWASKSKFNFLLFTPDFSEGMALIKEKLFEDENLVIISSKDAINMKEWRDHLIKNWDKVLGFLFFHNGHLLLPNPMVNVSDFKKCA